MPATGDCGVCSDGWVCPSRCGIRLPLFEICAGYFKGSPPTSTLAGADLVHKEMLVEINDVAVIQAVGTNA